MKFRFVLPAFACALAVACHAEPKVPLAGQWRVIVQGNGGEANGLDLKVEIRKNGTYTLTGNRDFQMMSGAREVGGHYEFVEDYKVHVTMESKIFDYKPTDYAIVVISKNQLVFNTADYAITLRRAE